MWVHSLRAAAAGAAHPVSKAGWGSVVLWCQQFTQWSPQGPVPRSDLDIDTGHTTLEHHLPPFPFLPGVLRVCVCVYARSRKRAEERPFLPLFTIVCLALNDGMEVKASEA